MKKHEERAELDLPVSVGQDYLVGKARIDIDGNDVTIVIKSVGKDGLLLRDFLLGGEVAALNFSYIPVQPRTPQ